MRQYLIEPNTMEPNSRRLVFLAALQEHTGNVSAAARCAGVHRISPYRWTKGDPDFAAKVRAIKRAKFLADCARGAAAQAAIEGRREQRNLELRPLRQRLAANARAAKRH